MKEFKVDFNDDIYVIDMALASYIIGLPEDCIILLPCEKPLNKLEAKEVTISEIKNAVVSTMCDEINNFVVKYCDKHNDN